MIRLTDWSPKWEIVIGNLHIPVSAASPVPSYFQRKMLKMFTGIEWRRK